MSLSLSSQATDFGINGDVVGVTGANESPNIAVSDSGIISDFTGVDRNAGIPTISLPLSLQAGADDGSYAFQTYLVVDDTATGSQRRLELALGTFTITVGGSGTTMSGTYNPSQSVQVYARFVDGSITAETTATELDNTVTFASNTITFDIQQSIDELGGTDAIWNRIDSEFSERDSEFYYAIVFKHPSSARLGNSDGGFTQFPCANTANLDSLFESNIAVASGPAYVLQGQFAMGTETIDASNPTPFSASCSASTGGGGTTPPPTDTTIDEVEDLIDDVDIDPEDITGDDAETVNEIAENAAAVTNELAEAINSGNLTDDDAIGALDTLTTVVQTTGTVAVGTSTTNTNTSTQTSNSGISVLGGVTNVLKSLDTSVNRDVSGNGTANRELSTEQKAAVKSVVVKAVTSAVQLLATNPSNSQKAAVLQNMGAILSSSINLGVPLTEEETDAAYSATDATPLTGDDDDDLGIPVAPQNKQLISRNSLTTLLANAGVSADEADVLITQLAQSINPADVNVGETNGQDALLTGLLGALGGTPGSATPDASTGRVTVGINTGVGTDSELGKVSSTARTIPARAISSNIVSSGFPDGLRVRAGGGVIITSNRIATVMVPASYSPIDFYTGLRSLGSVTVGANDGNLNIDTEAFPFGFHFTGTFDYTGIITGGSPVSRTSLDAPDGEDESDLNFIYMVTYPDGTRQRIQPYISEDDFIADIKARNLTIFTNRNTGVVTVNGRQYRPSYFVDQLNNTTRDYLEANADEFGLAFRMIDMNEDGMVDVQIISEIGAQTAYRLP